MVKLISQNVSEAGMESPRNEHDAKTEERQYFRFFRNHRIEKGFLEKKRDEWFDMHREATNYPDLIWAVSNELLHEYAMAENYFNMKMLYFELAFFEKSMKNEYFSLLQESKRMELLDIKKNFRDNIDSQVVIRCGETDCVICSRLDGKILTIKEALENMPIPPEHCSHNDGWCTCCYTVDYTG
jgi:hypothetical protein